MVFGGDSQAWQSASDGKFTFSNQGVLQEIVDLPSDVWTWLQGLWDSAACTTETGPVMEQFRNSCLGSMRSSFLGRLVQFRQGRRLPVVTEHATVRPHRIKHDIEQFEYLIDRDVLDVDLHQYVVDTVLPDYRRALVAARAASRTSDDSYAVKLEYQRNYSSLFSLHGRALHLHPGAFVPGGAIADRDFEDVQRQLLQQEHKAVVMDEFLSTAALQQLRDFVLESTFWLETKPGFVGTYLHTGFASPLVAQIDQELRSKLPYALNEMELQTAWAFMYDGSLGGINTHADDAQVQINLFITPTQANLWSEDSAHPAGGMVIYGVGPPSSWGAEAFNTDLRASEIEKLISSTDHWNVTIPYVQNRAILFDSTYFHKTDEIVFKPGYKNRRINVTFLYGKRRNLQPAIVVGSLTQQ
jgi:hypothetical protein